jgi:hypothetical protein
VVLYGAPDSYFRDEGAAAVACLPAPQAWASLPLVFKIFLLVGSAAFFVIHKTI